MATRVGRYVLLKQLASGELAEVHLARSADGDGPHLAVKRIAPDHARDERFFQRFLEAARVATTLNHPNLVRIHDMGEADGEYFIAMEYVHGEDVRTLLA